MRLGFNPNRNKPAPVHVPPVVAGVISHLPNQDGYHAGRLEIVQKSLVSLRQNAGAAHKTFVWDNGSCDELRRWLMYDYQPDYLFLSPNTGKSFARSAVLKMFPPETIIAMADDDMLYYPGWLAAQIAVLEHFPNAGQVTGYPSRLMGTLDNENTLAWAKKNANVSTGEMLPQAWEDDFAWSVGMTPAIWRAQSKSLKTRECLIIYKGMKAWGMSHHCQFVCYAGRLANVAPVTERATGNERMFDDAVDKAGLLRLATYDRYTRHMGNVLDEDLLKELERLGL